MKYYKHIFFDLDHTLWDVERNSSETLMELLSRFDLGNEVNSAKPTFVENYNRINDALWERYRKGEIDRQTLRRERFVQLFDLYGLKDESLAQEFSRYFVTEAPRKPHLIKGAKELLDHLSGKYTLHIITNGFAEAQVVKMASSGISNYFTHIITSERAGCNKPDIRIFEYSLDLAGASKDESIMIGDHLEADIQGAKGAGIDQVYYNPLGIKHKETITYEIREMGELVHILR